MPKRTRSSGGSEDPVPDPPSKRTRSASKSPGSAPPKQPKQPQKPKGAKGAKKKPHLITLEAKPEHWLNKLPDNHGTYNFLRLGDNLGSAIGKTG